MTSIDLFDHCSGLRDYLEIDAPRELIIERLRQVIPEPQFDISDEDEFTVHARVDVDPIQVHINGYPASMVSGGWHEILGVLTRRAIA